MKFKDNTKKIKKALLKGGLVVAGRGVGKTRALAEILSEDRSYVVIVGTQVQFSNLRKYLKENHDFTDGEVISRVFNAHSAEFRLLGTAFGFPFKKVYLDEYVNNPYRGPFYAAVTSFPFTTKVIT